MREEESDIVMERCDVMETEGVGSVDKARGIEREEWLHVGEGELLAVVLMLDGIDFLSDAICHRKEVNEFVNRIRHTVGRITLGMNEERKTNQDGGGKGRFRHDVITQPALNIYRTLPYQRMQVKSYRIQDIKYHE